MFKRIHITLPAILLLAVFSAACNKFHNHGQATRFQVTIENTGGAYKIIKSGAFTMKVGGSSAGPILPGESFEFSFTAPVGAHFSLATMFVQSNDWFYSTDGNGLPLYKNDGSKMTGDVTSYFHLYDAGTEADQTPGEGDNQAPRQSAPNTGPADPNNTVREVTASVLPAVDQVIKVTLMDDGSPYGFKVRVENESDNMTLQTSMGGVPVPLSPGVWIVFDPSNSNLLFTEGQADYGMGLEHIAEDGNPSELADNLAKETGITVPLSPTAYAVYKGDNPIFMEGQPADDNGLEGLAEDGNPSMLSTVLQSDKQVSTSGAEDTPVGASSPGILLPGHMYRFMVDAKDGDRFTFATMFAQSNDWFYSTGQNGIAFYDHGVPVHGDVTSKVYLWDAGTEANEEPGIGSNQAPRQSAPNTGPDDPNNLVRMVNMNLPKGIKVTITPIVP